ncbi:hypothetical protein GCM10009798_33530 [Nocardioides panacihumi]|uniref:Uncharacterized protein n=1 Tax=Nocardioides panacihumi TaxID=400774 RepID=A0ABN2RJF4_9ACTN
MNIHLTTYNLPGTSFFPALSRCDGTHTMGGAQVLCPEGCIAHYELEGKYEPANAILGMVDLLSGTAATEIWTGDHHRCLGRADRYAPWVTVHENSGDFVLEGSSRPLPVSIVTWCDPLTNGYGASLFTNEDAARNFSATCSGVYEDNCTCDN